jgi:uncharacterized protein YaiI (UPF0178 family)
MQIWVGADGCPRAISEKRLRVAERRRIPAVRIANRPLPPHASALVSTVRRGRRATSAETESDHP